MNASWVVSYAFAGVLIACAVLVMFAIVCGVHRHAHQRPNTQNEMRVMTAIMQEVDEEEEHRIDVAACMRPAHCVSSVNPDGSIAVARELTENKSVV